MFTEFIEFYNICSQKYVRYWKQGTGLQRAKKE